MQAIHYIFGISLYASLASGAILSYPPESPYPSIPYDSPPKYNFGWNVIDPYTGNDYGHKETRENDFTSGSYSVLLPDGRLQRVTYTVDGEGGYQADVTYEGIPSSPSGGLYFTSESKDAPSIKASPPKVKEIPFLKEENYSGPRKYTYRPLPPQEAAPPPKTTSTPRPLEAVVVTNPIPTSAPRAIPSSTPPLKPVKKYTYTIKSDKLKREVLHLPNLFQY